MIDASETWPDWGTSLTFWGKPALIGTYRYGVENTYENEGSRGLQRGFCMFSAR